MSVNAIEQNIAAIYRKEVDKQALNQRMMAQDINISPQLLSHVLNGRRSMGIEKVVDIAEYLQDPNVDFEVAATLFHTPKPLNRKRRDNHPLSKMVGQDNEVNRSNISINGRNNSVNQGNNQQSKVKESKEKEIKEDATASEGASLETFQKLWLFPNVVQADDLLNLVDVYGDELVEAAIKLAGSKDVPKNRAISFLTASLQEWADANVKTINQARDYQRTRGAKKQVYNQKPVREEKLPDWAVNEQEEAQLSPERQAELDAKLAAYLNKTKH